MFNKGDLVVCRDNQGVESCLTEGVVYEVTDVPTTNSVKVVSDLYSTSEWFQSYRFEKYESPKTGWQQINEALEEFKTYQKEEPTCDCGSKYAFGNMHSNWCSTQEGLC